MSPLSLKKSRPVLRIAVGALLVLALGGPSPGHIGSCDGSAELAGAADFCERYRTYYCARELMGGRLPASEYQACIQRTGPNSGDPFTYCSRFAFTPGCEPSQRTADACIDALARTDVSVRSDDIQQCDFCGGGV